MNSEGSEGYAALVFRTLVSVCYLPVDMSTLGSADGGRRKHASALEYSLVDHTLTIIGKDDRSLQKIFLGSDEAEAKSQSRNGIDHSRAQVKVDDYDSQAIRKKQKRIDFSD